MKSISKQDLLETGWTAHEYLLIDGNKYLVTYSYVLQNTEDGIPAKLYIRDDNIVDIKSVGGNGSGLFRQVYYGRIETKEQLKLIMKLLDII